MNLNEKLFRSKIEDLDEFYDFIKQLKTSPNMEDRNLINRIYFWDYKHQIGIPGASILHGHKKHILTLEDWQLLLDNLNKPELYVEAKSGKAFTGTNYLLKYNIDWDYYGLGICDTKEGYLITTLFKDDENSIDNWLEGNGKTPPKMPTVMDIPGFSLSEGFHNIIINDKKKNVNLSIKDLNEVLQKYIEE